MDYCEHPNMRNGYIRVDDSNIEASQCPDCGEWVTSFIGKPIRDKRVPPPHKGRGMLPDHEFQRELKGKGDK